MRHTKQKNYVTKIRIPPVKDVNRKFQGDGVKVVGIPGGEGGDRCFQGESWVKSTGNPINSKKIVILNVSLFET